MSDIANRELDAALVMRLRSIPGVTHLVPADRIYQGWYLEEETLPQIGCDIMVPGEHTLSGDRIPEDIEGIVTVTISAETVAQAAEIAAAVEAGLEEPWEAHGCRWDAVRAARYRHRIDALRQVILDMSVIRSLIR